MSSYFTDKQYVGTPENRASRLGADLSDKPNVKAYIARLNARPAMQKAWAT